MKSATIITVYKRYNYVAQAIQSLLVQTERPDQVIIVSDDPDRIKNLSSLKELPDPIILKADYPDLGRKITDATEHLYEDIDVVFFLEDDDMFKANKIERIKDYFEKYKNVVLVHNHQEYIDENGNKVKNYTQMVIDKNQPNEKVLISRRNVKQILRKYPHIAFGNSSISIRRFVLGKYKSILRELKLNVDTSIVLLSLLEGHVLHVPERLTYYRIGSGITTYPKALTYKEFVEINNKKICVLNNIIDDHRILLEALGQCGQCKAVAERNYLIAELFLYLFNSYFTCNYKSKTLDTPSFIIKSIKSTLKGEISILDLIKILAVINLSLILGKKKVAEIILKRDFKRISAGNDY